MKQINHTLLPFIVFVAMLMQSTVSQALSPTFTALFSDVAIRGYDTVAYFTDNVAVKGDPAFATEYNEATWHFVSQENLDLFKKNPEKYVPQYGGYCAYAVSQNTTAPVQPDQFTIHEGKLYLNYSEKVNKTWLKDKEQYISDANKNWPSLLKD